MFSTWLGFFRSRKWCAFVIILGLGIGFHVAGALNEVFSYFLLGMMGTYQLGNAASKLKGGVSRDSGSN